VSYFTLVTFLCVICLIWRDLSPSWYFCVICLIWWVFSLSWHFMWSA
jgi:hypothetical protein